MNQRPGTPGQALRSIVQNGRLILDLTRREVLGRYRGSVGGLVWSFIHPLLLLAVYTFVFSVVFQARWGGSTSGSRSEFAIVVFMGMIVHGLLAECINRAPMLIVSNANFVKRVIFPLEILPVVALGSALFHALASTVILLAVQFWLTGSLPIQTLWLPVVLLPLMILTLGLAWFLSAIGVYLRDIGQLTGLLTTVLMFLSPVFYPVSALPPDYRGWLNLSPLTFIIEQARAVAIEGRLPDLPGLVLYTIVAMLVFSFGFWWFQRSRSGFADVL